MLPQLRDLEKRIRAHKEKTMGKHAERVAEIIKGLEAMPNDTRPLLSLDLPQDKTTK